MVPILSEKAFTYLKNKMINFDYLYKQCMTFLFPKLNKIQLFLFYEV